MDNLSKEKVVPQQQEGSSSDVSSSFDCQNENEAISFYQTVRARLLNVNEWEKIAGMASADFRLCDSNGNEITREVQLQDHFKIDVPGPGTVTGDGYDWVKVESIEEGKSEQGEMITITVRPATNPTNQRSDVAHFFDGHATSSFIVERKGNTVTATVAGRNEKPNADTETVIDKARNLAVAAGAISAFSKIQWKGLVEGLVKSEK